MRVPFKQILKFNNSLRNARIIEKALLWKKTALSQLSVYIKNSAGRANTGRIVARFRGSCARQRVRVVSNTNTFFCVPGKIIRIEYDPNRSSFISLVLYSHGICTYVLHTLGLSLGDVLFSHLDISLPGFNGISVHFNLGDSCSLFCSPHGTVLHNLETIPFSGGLYIRSAGTFGLVMKKFFRLRKCLIQLPSKQLRSFSFFCSVTKGVVSNDLHYRVLLGKAGRARLFGYKPIVRGVAKNPVDHPHGGGEGKKSKKCFPRTAWGKMLH